MERFWISLVDFFSWNNESYSLKEGTLILVLAILIIALTISFVVAKRNHLYGGMKHYDEAMNESE